MKGKATILGHPIHPMLIVLPLGLLPASLLADLVYFNTRREFWGEMAYWLIIGGILGGLLAAVFGFIDWLSIPANTRAKRVGLIHAVLNVTVVAIFAVSWWMRRGDPSHPPLAATILGAIAIVLALLSGWLGGELVYRLSIGVDEKAHPNAPSSLDKNDPHS